MASHPSPSPLDFTRFIGRTLDQFEDDPAGGAGVEENQPATVDPDPRLGLGSLEAFALQPTELQIKVVYLKGQVMEPGPTGSQEAGDRRVGVGGLEHFDCADKGDADTLRREVTDLPRTLSRKGFKGGQGSLQRFDSHGDVVQRRKGHPG